jgi:hypothetical protein
MGGPPMMGGAPMGGGAGGDVNTTLPLILGILSCFCCGISLALGITAIVFSQQAKSAKAAGDMATAQQKAKLATILGAVGIGIGVILDIGYTLSMRM